VAKLFGGEDFCCKNQTARLTGLYLLRRLEGGSGYVFARSVGRFAPSFPRKNSTTFPAARLAAGNVRYNRNVMRNKNLNWLEIILTFLYKYYIKI
jgi:hypothetical protein